MSIPPDEEEPHWVKALRAKWWSPYLVKIITILIAASGVIVALWAASTTRSTFISANQAQIDLDQYVLSDAEPRTAFSISYGLLNTGKGQGTVMSIVTDGVNFFPITPTLNAFETFQHLSVPPNDSCSARDRHDWADTAPLSLSPNMRRYDVQGLNGPVSRTMVKALEDGQYSFYVQGCITYRTEGNILKSSFCIIPEPQAGVPMGRWDAGRCGELSDTG